VADTVGVRVEGLSSVTRGLQALGSDVQDLDAFATLAAQAAQAASSAVDSESGTLAGGIRGERTKNRAGVTASVEYAGPINYGWPARNIEGQGFMQEADAVIEPRSVEIIEDEINRKIRQKGL
jgi:hypothetical protein